MAFITEDDHIILFEPLYGPDALSVGRRLTLDNLKRLRDAGIRTILRLLPWREIQNAQGERDWTYVESRLDEAGKVGMKTLLVTYDQAVHYLPYDWYIRNREGKIANDIFSPWNRQAQAYSVDFIQSVIARYSSTDVCCICGFCREGEWLLPPHDYFFYDVEAIRDFQEYARRKHADDLEAFNRSNGTSYSRWNVVLPVAADTEDTRAWLRESFVRYVVDLQSLFAPAHGEIWMMIPRYFDFETGASDLDEIYGALNTRIGATLYGINFDYFPHGRRPLAALDDQNKHGIKFFVGSHWAEGLRQNTALAIRQGLRGLVTAPLHPLNGHDEFEGWMASAVQASVGSLVGASRSIHHPRQTLASSARCRMK